MEVKAAPKPAFAGPPRNVITESLPPTDPLPLRKVTVSADKLTASKVKITKDFSEYIVLIGIGFGLQIRKK